MTAKYNALIELLTQSLVVISCFVGPDKCLNFHHFINLTFQKEAKWLPFQIIMGCLYRVELSTCIKDLITHRRVQTLCLLKKNPENFGGACR